MEDTGNFFLLSRGFENALDTHKSCNLFGEIRKSKGQALAENQDRLGYTSKISTPIAQSNACQRKSDSCSTVFITCQWLS